jgi:hypothetical protein
MRAVLIAVAAVAVLAAQDRSATVGGEVGGLGDAGVPGLNVNLTLEEHPHTIF